jgi:hypothetical protein
MIRINLHDYRYELTKIEIQKRLIKCFVIVIEKFRDYRGNILKKRKTLKLTGTI